MADVLSQDEINALIETYQATGTADHAGRTQDNRQVRLYDFSRPNKFSKEHLRALNQIHVKHGTLFSIALASRMRVDVQVSVLALDQLTFKEYCASVPDSTLFAEVNLEPLAPIAIFEFNPPVVGMCVDLLAGASSISLTNTKITEVDKAVMRQVIELSLKKYAEAWAPLIDLKPRIIAITTESATRQPLLPSEGVLVCGYEISIAKNVSMMSICIPAWSVEPVAPSLSVNGPIKSKPQQNGAVNKTILRNFENVKVECRAILGRTSMPMEDVMHLEVGDIIRLPNKKTDPAEFWVENVPTFCGLIGRSGRNLALKITKAFTDN